jgi:hypothetical protein
MKKAVFWDLAPCICGANRKRISYIFPSTLKMEAIRFSETSVNTTYARCQILEDSHRRESLKSYNHAIYSPDALIRLRLYRGSNCSQLNETPYRKIKILSSSWMKFRFVTLLSTSFAKAIIRNSDLRGRTPHVRNTTLER